MWAQAPVIHRLQVDFDSPFTEYTTAGVMESTKSIQASTSGSTFTVEKRYHLQLSLICVQHLLREHNRQSRCWLTFARYSSLPIPVSIEVTDMLRLMNTCMHLENIFWGSEPFTWQIPDQHLSPWNVKCWWRPLQKRWCCSLCQAIVRYWKTF